MSNGRSTDGGQGTGGTSEPLDMRPDTDTGGNIVSPVQQLATAADAGEIWTAAAMEAAQPCDLIEIDEDALDRAAQAAQDGAGQVIAGGPPADEGEEARTADVEVLGYSYPPPFTRYENFADYSLWPYRTVGKLFFKQGGTSYVCSASSIGNCAIITAGHCVHQGNNAPGGWATDVVFVPAYRDGNAPFGQWPARYLITRTQWYQNGIPKGLSEDIGGAVLHKQGGRKISERVGWLGFAWNWSRVQHWHSTGYPAAPPFNGQRQQICASSYAYDGSVGASPNPVGAGNDLTGGCSGGPWIRQFGSGNQVNGVNSYRRSTHPLELYSPYFGDAAKSLYDSLVAGTC
jgi:V8-like Glu-specific endopeptidase